jgi:hypothetical protein
VPNGISTMRVWAGGLVTWSGPAAGPPLALGLSNLSARVAFGAGFGESAAERSVGFSYNLSRGLTDGRPRADERPPLACPTEQKAARSPYVANDHNPYGCKNRECTIQPYCFRVADSRSGD